MDAPPLVSPEVLASLPAEVLALIKWQARQIQLLTARVAALEAELAQLKQGGKNPTNSSLPPSTTHPHAKPLSTKPKSKRSRGGQPGHAKQERTLFAGSDAAAAISSINFRSCLAGTTRASRAFARTTADG
jgi:transposase